MHIWHGVDYNVVEFSIAGTRGSGMQPRHLGVRPMGKTSNVRDSGVTRLFRRRTNMPKEVSKSSNPTYALVLWRVKL